MTERQDVVPSQTVAQSAVLDPRIAQALVVRKAINVWRRTGLRPNRRWTNRRMAEIAGKIVGRELTGRELPLAEQLLTLWLERARSDAGGPSA